MEYEIHTITTAAAIWPLWVAVAACLYSAAYHASQLRK